MTEAAQIKKILEQLELLHQRVTMLEASEWRRVMRTRRENESVLHPRDEPGRCASC